MMKTLSQPLFALCAVLFPLFVYAQEDTLNADGLFPKYNLPSYRGNGLFRLTMEQIRNGDTFVETPKDSDRERGVLDTISNKIGLTYKKLPQYIISENFHLKSFPDNPDELCCTAGEVITSQWIHEDGECILFMKCEDSPGEDVNGRIPKNVYNWIRSKMNVTRIDLREITDEEIDKIKKRITVWSRSEAEEVFNARYVITYPIRSRKSVYMGKYRHRLDWILLKESGSLTVSFLVTRKGQRHLDQYIEDVKGAFRFED